MSASLCSRRSLHRKVFSFADSAGIFSYMTTSFFDSSRTEPAEWVVVRLSALGDLALITGVLDYWHRTRGWRFTVVTREAFAPVLERHPAVREIVALPRDELVFPRQMGVFRALAQKHAGKGLLDLHGTLRTRLLSVLWKGPVRRYRKLGVERRLFLKSGGLLFRESLLRWNVPQRYALAVEETPPPRSELLPHIWLSEEEQARGSLLLDRLPETGTPPVALHPYATHPDKAWHEAHWRRLMAMLDERRIPWIVVGRGKGMAGLPEVRDFTNQTTLRETCALLRASSALVTGDSGPMHLACAVATPVVALFGPTTEAWGFFPAGVQDRVLQSDLDCRPCTLHGKKHCDHDHACMRLITPEQVMAVLGQ